MSEQSGQVTITIRENGPYRVERSVKLMDANGNNRGHHHGASLGQRDGQPRLGADHVYTGREVEVARAFYEWLGRLA